MPTVTFNTYDKFRQGQFNGNAVDFNADTLKMAIVTAAYTPDQNLHDNWDDVSANEVSGSGYTAGGNSCANIAVALTAGGLVTVDVGDPATWAESSTGFSNGRRAVLYKDTGTATTSRLVGYSNDFGRDEGNFYGNFSIEVDAAGVLTNARP